MTLKQKVIKEVEGAARKYFKNASGCHDWSHVDRVRNLALYIGRKEKADLFVLEIAALLHDIGRKKEMINKGKFCHAEIGSDLAEKILKKLNFNEKEISSICHCIITHRFRNACVPNSIEAKVLYDADKLDSIGAIGVARTFLFAGNAGSNTIYTGNEKKIVKSKKDYSYTKEDSGFLEYEIKLKHIKNKILTKTGKKIAENRHKYMKDYFKRMWLEVKGEK